MSDRTISVCFADLIHTKHSNINVIPLGIALVAAYALDRFRGRIKTGLFKYPDDFNKYLNKAIPDVACFSNYIWNINLNYEFAEQIKIKSPGTVIVFGGPNYPLETEAQEKFLLSHPAIDFYVFMEGERSFAGLLNILFEHDFDVPKIKRLKPDIPGCHYMSDGGIVKGRPLPPITQIDELPSAYLNHSCDKFLDRGLMPLMYTTRGCPFSCTFCQQGDEYFSHIRSSSLERVRDELRYIAQRTHNPILMFADSNFGMYKHDIDICREIALIKKQYAWPKFFFGPQGKNNKAHILKAASIARSAGIFVPLSAAVQSTDEKVLKNIRRSNVSLSVYFDIAKTVNDQGLTSFSEIIVCLPGDTKEAHFKSAFELIDAGMHTVRSHQLIMLEGAQISTRKSRLQYEMMTRFRVMPKTVDSYHVFEKSFITPEIDEICVSNSSMSFDDYLECRIFNLTIEVFYNNGIFQELLNFLKIYRLSGSSFIMNIHNKMRSFSGPLSNLYNSFLKETKELWESREDVEKFLRQKGVIDRYISGELGNNEQLMYRAIIILKHMEDLNSLAFDVARDMLAEKISINKEIHDYLEELSEFCLLRKKDMLLAKQTLTRTFHYDFVALQACNFNDNPLSYHRPQGIGIEFSHTTEQKELIDKYIKNYGLSNNGIGNILSEASMLHNLYRKATTVQKEETICRSL